MALRSGAENPRRTQRKLCRIGAASTFLNARSPRRDVRKTSNRKGGGGGPRDSAKRRLSVTVINPQDPSFDCQRIYISVVIRVVGCGCAGRLSTYIAAVPRQRRTFWEKRRGSTRSRPDRRARSIFAVSGTRTARVPRDQFYLGRLGLFGDSIVSRSLSLSLVISRHLSCGVVYSSECTAAAAISEERQRLATAASRQSWLEANGTTQAGKAASDGECRSRLRRWQRDTAEEEEDGRR